MKPDVAIVGAGFSGLFAADLLAGFGLHVLLLDEYIRPGGQLLRTGPGGKSPAIFPADKIRRSGFAMLDHIRGASVDFRGRTRVLGIFPGNPLELLVEEDESRTYRLSPRAVLLATGAREKFLPFPGWTLPGVISTGGLQILMKGSGVIPSEKIGIAGSGLFPFAVASEAVKNGAGVTAVLERGSVAGKIPSPRLLIQSLEKFLEGGRYLAALLRSGTPIRFHTAVVEARGRGRLEAVTIARMDGEGRVISGSQRTLETECLAIGHGFTANIELARQAGCRLEYSPGKGGWVVSVCKDLKTSVDGIYAAGEITGIGGAAKSLLEGRLAALGILHGLGKIDAAEFFSLTEKLAAQRKKHLAFGAYFNTLTGFPGSAVASIPDETVICRCEDVTMREIRAAVANGYHSPGALKKVLRPAMGNCQGRTCGPIIHEIIASLTGTPAREIPPFTVRSPVKPATLGSLADLAEFSHRRKT
jgi:NADPH-dependent 2,4-dienoyl-CoA reductase/sulfur reductase-like enzyme